MDASCPRELASASTFRGRFGEPRNNGRMPSSIVDVLNAVQGLAYRGDEATADAVAADLATTRDDVAPQLVSAHRAGLLEAAKRPDGTSVFGLTGDGERALTDETQ